jgi:hypothetical protein
MGKIKKNKIKERVSEWEFQSHKYALILDVIKVKCSSSLKVKVAEVADNCIY